MVDLTIRTARADDFAEIAQLDTASFGEAFSGEMLEMSLSRIDPDRFLVACDGPRIVGVTGDYPFTMTVPGGALPVPGVTWVSVEVTHRRRGVLTALMRQQLASYRDQGVAAAILTASEGAIYGRFGYGAASQIRKTVLDRRRARLAVAGDAGNVTRCTAEQARKLLPALHDRWRAETPAAINRTDTWWDVLLADKEWQRDDMSPLFHLVHDGGYVSYRIKADWNDGAPQHLCWIVDYVVITEQARRDLWQVLLGLDLVGAIETYRIPVDDPLPYLLTDGRQLRTAHVADGIWLRPIDPAAMLTARCYAVEIDCVLEVRDELFGHPRLQLRGGPDGVSCEPTDRSADVDFDVTAFGAAYVGGTRLGPLATAGLVRADDAALLSRLDRALLADRSPAHGTGF
jgi:predicted acetyltransferase